jgi:hypothetical protein
MIKYGYDNIRDMVGPAVRLDIFFPVLAVW